MKYRIGLVLTVLLGLGLSVMILVSSAGVAHGLSCGYPSEFWQLELTEVVVDGERQNDLTEYELLSYELQGREDLFPESVFYITKDGSENKEIERMRFEIIW